MTILISNVCSSFAEKAIGSRVTDPDAFLLSVIEAIKAHNPSADRVAGQHTIVMPPETYSMVSAGVGKRWDNPIEYVLREHRGQVTAYLRRENAAPVEGLTVIVYTREAYLADPDTQTDLPEMERVTASDATHILVAVLASAGPRSLLSPDRFVKNLAGENREALAWTADEIRVKAAEIAAYHKEWAIVAD
jgi:hypothetical protein